ncbi:MAG: hypothetical protein PHW60_16685 [Kiritimatiellae bacterium]|nr:hypothetical protein [Kiritimatiellia bacterium]
MISSYYLWKWADNDLPGKPDQVFSALVRGKLHPALQAFDARRLLRCLETFADSRRALGEDWNWQVHPGRNPMATLFVFLSGPHLNDYEARVRSFAKAMNGLEISGYDEESGHIIPTLQPKTNCLLFGQDSRERYYELTADEVPPLLRHIDGAMRDPFAVLEDRRHYFVQCLAKKRRFFVEWRENYDTNNWNDFAHWRAWLPKQAHRDLLTFAETVRIFQTFLRGEPKPSRYYWHDIRPELEKEDARRNKRRTTK